MTKLEIQHNLNAGVSGAKLWRYVNGLFPPGDEVDSLLRHDVDVTEYNYLECNEIWP
jgi:hypothetical protein